MNTSAKRLFGSANSDRLLNGKHLKRVWTGNYEEEKINSNDSSTIPPERDSEFYKNPLSLSQIISD
jgi:hypothetical protein